LKWSHINTGGGGDTRKPSLQKFQREALELVTGETLSKREKAGSWPHTGGGVKKDSLKEREEIWKNTHFDEDLHQCPSSGREPTKERMCDGP